MQFIPTSNDFYLNMRCGKMKRYNLIFISLLIPVLQILAQENVKLQLVGRYDTKGYARDVFVSGIYAYVADESFAPNQGGGLRVIDISNPNSPIQVGSIDISGSAEAVDVSGSYAFIADWYYGLRVIDVSNPQTPNEIGNYDTKGNAADIEVSGSFAYVTDTKYGLRIIDVSNPGTPQETGYYYPPTLQRGIFIKGNYAYVNSGKTLRILDVSDPTVPRELGFYTTNYEIHGIFIYNNYAFLANDVNGLLILDISNPVNISVIGQYTPSSFSAFDVYVAGNYAYVTSSYGGLHLVDISNPYSPKPVSAYTLYAPSWGVFVSVNYIYVATHNLGLYILKLESITDIEQDKNILPQQIRLFQNYPNPFNPTTTITYELPRTCEVNVTIYNTLGQKIRTLVRKQQTAGRYEVMWDGRDESGQEVASGVYIYQLRAGEFVQTRKMILMR